MATVILGSGIIGLSTAYYLVTTDAQPAHTIHLVDASPHLFSSASGFAAGFIARDWHRPAVAELAALSFAEHARLAEEHGGAARWGYANTRALSYEAQAGAAARDGKRGEDWLLEGTSRALAKGSEGRRDGDLEVPRWWRRRAGDAASVVDESGTGIVDPLNLCRFLLGECEACGVKVHHPATAVAITTDDGGVLSGVRIRYADSRAQPDAAIPATRVLLAAGSWTPHVFRTLFPASRTAIPVTSLAGHSLVVRTPPGTHHADATHAMFCAVPAFSPEIFSRPSGVIYVAGLNSSTLPLPEPAGPASPVAADLQTLRTVAAQLIDSGDAPLEILREALCFRPVTAKGTPLLGRIADAHLGAGVRTRGAALGGVFLAVGHGPWGISLSLGTGKVMAELMHNRALSADISALGLDAYRRQDVTAKL
ncbi:putative oxidoreductase [Escovopsis weberi]|uniref:Putative oxidoreductase n=1 Tax=Escovopsis weberi TaxID=150374 RepID=A0A0M8N6F3_ESCWE|nr:putative oxidoreductase [Escovopsis weberi]